MDGTKHDLSVRFGALLQMAQAANLALFGPGAPPQPLMDDEPPRLFEYQPGINLVTVPRAGFGVLPLPVLRALAQSSKEIRLNIELIKRTVRGLEWDIVSRNAIDGYQTVTGDVRNFFERPNGVDDFDAWVNQLLETLLTIDAVTIYPDIQNGKLVSLDLVDGATIRPLLDLRGRTPRPPMPAYLQVLYGAPMTHYTAEQLLYAPLNAKTHTPYGESPIEWALMAINTAIRHDAVRLGWFTEGNIPGVLVSVSPDWTPDQLQTFTEYFDALTKGDIQRASKILFVPGNGAQSIFQPNQGDADKIEVDKWLMQVVCWAFGNNPAEFGLVPSSGLGGAGYVQGMENAQYRSMIGPITGYLKALFDRIIRDYVHRPDLEFKWLGLEPPEDQMQRAQIDQIYLSTGVYTPAYVQERMGVPPEFRQMSPVPKFDFSSLFERAAKYELHRWRQNAVALKKGKTTEEYVCEILPLELQNEIRKCINVCTTADEVVEVFDAYLDGDLTKRLFPAAEVGAAQPFRYP